jgi:hypothetical protein
VRWLDTLKALAEGNPIAALPYRSSFREKKNTPLCGTDQARRGEIPPKAGPLGRLYTKNVLEKFSAGLNVFLFAIPPSGTRA